MPDTENTFIITPDESSDWTTEDEIAFVRHLYNRRNLKAMSDYRRMLPYRDFRGAGMHVDVMLVRLALNSLIDALETELL